MIYQRKRSKHRSPPRMRGTPGLRIETGGQRPFTPAHAGNTQESPESIGLDPVHPRACGEHIPELPPITKIDRSPPRMRGTLKHLQYVRNEWRFTPAHAGNTQQVKIQGHQAPVHPRACGEHVAILSLAGLCDRFTPAHAGNTDAAKCRISALTVHPRACGEHRCEFGRGASKGRSPPRMRGTLMNVSNISLLVPFTPAHAGNTLPVVFPTAPAPVHPRACGEHARKRLREALRARSPPRMRGTLLHLALLKMNTTVYCA